jgi:signal transduction histidine kinase
LLYGARAAHDRLLSNAEVFALGAIERAQTLAEVVQYDPALLERLSTEDFRVAITPALPRQPAEGWQHSAEVEQAVRALLARGGSDAQIAGLWFESKREGQRHRSPRLVIVLPQGDQWLQVRVLMRIDSWRNPPAGALGTAVFALLIFGAVLWGTRRVTRFLPRFAEAAERVGRGQGGGPLAIEGPREVRRAARAFNDMQARVADHVAERSTMMAAFSHDLRTLATRLALRGRAAPLTATMRTSADLADWKVHGQPVALQRAFANLIDNAIAYGGDVWLRLGQEPGAEGQPGIAVSVCDPGPGIPEADQARVTKAYVRLEGSRNRETGGTGLGLAIVSNVVRRHGGTLRFVRDQGTDRAAFCARVWLPRAASGPATGEGSA